MKKYRIVENDLVCKDAFHPLRWRIEERYTLLFFIHWWNTPSFAPPHNFEFYNDAVKYILEQKPNAVILMNQKRNN